MFLFLVYWLNNIEMNVFNKNYFIKQGNYHNFQNANLNMKYLLLLMKKHCSTNHTNNQT